MNKLDKYKAPALTKRRTSRGPAKNKPDPENKNKKKKGRLLTPGRIILLTFLTLLFLLLLIINIFLYVYKPSTNETVGIDLPEFIDTDEEGNPVSVMLPDKDDDCYTFLILGKDVGGTNTDTMMIVMFNVKENTVSILNIPRDTYVSTNNHTGIINAVYIKGRNNAIKDGVPRGDEASVEGIKYLCGMINYTFRIPINFYVFIDLEGFKVLVDEIGGVEYDVPFRMKYTDPAQGLYIDLQPGLQHLNGDQAEQLVRFRHGDYGYPGYGRTIDGVFYPSEDIGRIQTQQRFIAALMKKMFNNLSINSIKALFKVSSDYMITNMSLDDVLWFAPRITNIKLENIRTHTLPTNWVASDQRLYVYIPETIEIVNKYYNPYKIDIPESYFNIFYKDMSGMYKPEINIDGETMDNMVK